MLVNAVLGVKKPRRAEVAATFILRTEMLRDAPAANLDVLLRLLVCNESHDLLAGDVGTLYPDTRPGAVDCGGRVHDRQRYHDHTPWPRVDSQRGR